MILNYLKAMAIFTSVVENGSFSAAGKQLDMPRGKVSDQVARLESYLGVKLLKRTTRNLSLTAEGQALYQSTSGLLSTATESINEVRSYEQQVKGSIKITTTSDIYQYQLLPLLEEFSQQYPQVTYDLVITEQSLAIHDQSIDIAIRSGPISNNDYIGIQLHESPLKVYGSSKNDYSHLTTPEQLEQESMLGIHGFHFHTLGPICHTNGTSKILSLQEKHFTNDVPAYIQLAKQGLGLAILPTRTAEKMCDEGSLQLLLADWQFRQLPVYLLYPNRTQMARRCKLLIEIIKRRMGEDS